MGRAYTRWGLFVFALTVSLLSIYFEFVVGLMPCALCISQRVAFFVLTLIFLLWCFVKRKAFDSLCFYSALIFTLLGLGFAVRQVYLQLFPHAAASCGPSFSTLIKFFPTSDIIHALFYGTHDCARVQWTFLHLSMAAWSMLAFLFVLVVLISYRWLRTNKAI